MFRPVQNPDDEEVEGRVRTRTRTKELVYLLLELSGVDQRTSLLELLFSFHFFSPSLSSCFALTMGVQNARNRPKQDSGNNSPEPEGNERRSHRKSPSSASNCSSSSSSVVHEKVRHLSHFF
jgi:hypothetical protein